MAWAGLERTNCSVRRHEICIEVLILYLADEIGLIKAIGGYSDSESLIANLTVAGQCRTCTELSPFLLEAVSP